jgi:putative oxidoreductase
VFDWTAMRLTWEPRMLSILRIMTGLLYLQHGLAKIFGFPALPNHAPYHLFSLVPGLAGILEMVGGALIALGLFTRPVAFILAGEMAFAYFMVNARRNFFPLVSGGDLVILYCFIFLYFFVAGAGIWSLDQLRAPGASAGIAAGRRV